MTEKSLDRAALVLAEGLRVSHCSNAANGHPCVGTCTVKPGGIIELACTLCGSDRIAPRTPTHEEARRAHAILRAAGLTLDALSEETQARVVEEMRRDCCPGCGTVRPLSGMAQINCVCGRYVYGYDGWRAAAPHARTTADEFAAAHGIETDEDGGAA